MNSKNKLLALLNESIEDFVFPFWELGEEYSIVMKMQCSGWSSNYGIGLLFELFEFFAKENQIQTNAILLATFKTDGLIKIAKLLLDLNSITDKKRKPVL